MSVLIHPTLASGDNKSELEKVQFVTGLRPTTTGHLVLPNGKHPAMRTIKPAHHTVFDHGPHDGDAA